MSKLLKHFKVSQSDHTTWNVVKTLLQTTVFWSIFLWVLPVGIQNIEDRIGILPFEFEGQKTAAIVIFVCASVLGLASGLTMSTKGKGTPLPLDCPQQLVVAGPYRYVRNPMAIAGLTQGFAVGLGIGSIGVIVYVLIGMWLWNQWVRPIEEEDLANRFHTSYSEYCRQIRCWVPNVHGYQSQ